MTDTNTEGTPAQGPDRPEKLKVVLSPAQVAASVLASISAAIVASYFGVAGTIIGTALASIFGTAGTAIYATGLKRTHAQLQHLRTVAAQAATPVTGSHGREPDHGPTGASVTHGRPGPDRTTELPTTALGEPVGLRPPESPQARVRPGRTFRDRLPGWPVLAGMVAVFVVAMGVVTVVEEVAGSPLSRAIYSKGTSGGSSVSDVVGGTGSSPTVHPATTTTTVATTSTSASSTTVGRTTTSNASATSTTTVRTSTSTSLGSTSSTTAPAASSTTGTSAATTTLPGTTVGG